MGEYLPETVIYRPETEIYLPEAVPYLPEAGIYPARARASVRAGTTVAPRINAGGVTD